MKTRQGDLFEAIEEARPLLIAHVVNSIGKWGKGFTEPLSRKYPFAETTYRKWSSRGLSLGKTLIVPVARRIFVAHMCAQDGVYSRNNPVPFNLEALKLALIPVGEFAYATGCPIWMPKIGAGLGRGNWDDIANTIGNELKELDVVVFEYAPTH